MASGLDTTVLALVLHPKVFERARDEIDRVVGTDRLPTSLDRPDLPYIDAISKEALRWENVVEISVYSVYIVTISMINKVKIRRV